MTGKKPFIAHS